MGLLQDIVHTITGNHGAPQAAEPVKGMASQFTPMAQPMQFAQYMNKDGSGGGFGPHNPSQSQHQGFSPRQAMSVAQAPVPMSLISPSLQGGQYNPGLIQMQGSHINYRQAPQAAQFNPIQGNQAAPQNPYQMY